MEKISVSRKFYKNPANSNPCLPNFFCADPGCIEYEGRLYVFATNDQQQYELEGDFGKNTYEKIKSLVVFSSEDLVNWTFHGVIDMDKVAPWALTSWAPAVVSRKEEDGLTHFYLYFSNTGYGVGVLTSTHPLGPWSSPLNHSLLCTGQTGIEEVPNPFDPGCCVDENGDGWLVFGGGIVQDHDASNPGSVRIVKLGKDLISLNSEFSKINAPYFFESSNLHYINHHYIYAFNSNWEERKNWPYEQEKSTQCSINYMVSKTPLDTDSWEYKGNYFKNPGDQGLNYSNNHTSLIKYKDQYYLFYHTLTLQEDMPVNGGFRSVCVDKISVDEENLEIKMCTGTRNGLAPICTINGFNKIPGSTMHTCAEVFFDSLELGNEIGAKSTNSGAWYSIKNVDFGNENSAAAFMEVELQKKNFTDEDFIEIRIDKLSAEPVARIKVCNENPHTQKIELNTKIQGIHTINFVFSNSDIVIKSWKLSY